MKIDLFFENARLLEEKLSITPLMYGSLGLEYITGESINADDIDILIPEFFLKDSWDAFKKILENEGYILIDRHENTFEKNGVCYSYASVEELEPFAGIKLTEIEQHDHNGIKFGLLSLEQYLRVYLRSSEDGYRINTRKKKDYEKLALIKKHLGITAKAN